MGWGGKPLTVGHKRDCTAAPTRTGELRAQSERANRRLRLDGLERRMRYAQSDQISVIFVNQRLKTRQSIEEEGKGKKKKRKKKKNSINKKLDMDVRGKPYRERRKHLAPG